VELRTALQCSATVSGSAGYFETDVLSVRRGVEAEFILIVIFQVSYPKVTPGVLSD
jgi:hypothetical protein